MFTDPQPESDAEVDFIREDVVSALETTNAKFGVTTGDLMFDDLSLYDRYNAIIGTIGVPWWNIGGNHDLNYEAPDRKRSRETYKRHFGAPYYAFAYAKTLFLMLDDVDYLGTDKSKGHAEGKYEGRLDAPQLDFIRNLLVHVPQDVLIVICMHIPLQTYLDIDGEPQGVLRAVRGPQIHGQLLRPHAYDRASLFRRRRGLAGRDAASSSRDDGGVGFLVERAL